jgi:tetratricopeptide (TPR) repeat protein
LVLALDKLRAGDTAGADTLAASLPADGVHRFATPFARAWARQGLGDTDGAIAALQPIGDVKGLGPLKDFHAALILDLAGRTDDAEAAYKAVLPATARVAWRGVEALGNFYERHGRAADAKALYERFVKENTESDLAEAALQRIERNEVPPPRVGAPRQRLAPPPFDLETDLNQGDTLDDALL